MHEITLNFATPWWVAVTTLFIALGISLWAYWNPFPPLPTRQRWTLRALRALALAALILALWQPVIGMLTTHHEEPQVAILLDNSASMRLRDASGSRDEQYRKALLQLHTALRGPTSRLARFDATVHPLEQWHPDSLTLDGAATDIAQALRWAASEAHNAHVRAVLLITDGVATAGESPLGEAEALGIPIVGILVGDTMPTRDLSVQSLIANDRVPLGSQTPVYATLTAESLGQQTVRVELWENGRRIGEEVLSIRPEQSSYTLRFDYHPQSEGIHRLRVRAASLPQETNLRNNEASTFVEVVRLRRRIIMFAGSPSPDFAFLRRELQRNPLIELSTFVHKDITSFYEGEPSPAILRQADAFILVDFPTRSTPESLLQSIVERALRGASLAWLAGPLTDRAKLRYIEPALPVTSSTTSAERELHTTISLAPTGMTHPLF
ncbi:MAG: VWA domain-containing protein, partial [Candidatus Kapabacteria bacterium]|nr:VWA domain-containing protein [Candidatus Kapabacteria bacterium]